MFIKSVIVQLTKYIVARSTSEIILAEHFSSNVNVRYDDHRFRTQPHSKHRFIFVGHVFEHFRPVIFGSSEIYSKVITISQKLNYLVNILNSYKRLPRNGTGIGSEGEKRRGNKTLITYRQWNLWPNLLKWFWCQTRHKTVLLSV